MPPYLACQAKKYSNAASGWPTMQKLIQKVIFPMTFAARPSIRDNGSVAIMRGIWNIIPANATPLVKY